MNIKANGTGDLYNALTNEGVSDSTAKAISQEVLAQFDTGQSNQYGEVCDISKAEESGLLTQGSKGQVELGSASKDQTMNIQSDGSGDLYNKLTSEGYSDTEAKDISKEVLKNDSTGLTNQYGSVVDITKAEKQGILKAGANGRIDASNYATLGHIAHLGYSNETSNSTSATAGPKTMNIEPDGTGDLYNALTAKGVSDADAKAVSKEVLALDSTGQSNQWGSVCNIDKAVQQGLLKYDSDGSVDMPSGGVGVDPGPGTH